MAKSRSVKTQRTRSARQSTKTTNATNRREEILDAAAEVLMEAGVEKLTLDAVAERAGVSKGGLIYHFPSKDELLLAMVERVMVRCNTAIEAELERAAEPEGTPGRYLRAYVRSCVGEDGNLRENEQQALSVGTTLLGVVKRLPRLMEVTSKYDRMWQERVENDGLDPLIAGVLRTAADGFWMSLLLGFDAGFKTPEQRAAIRRTLLRIIDDATGQTKAKGKRLRNAKVS